MARDALKMKKKININRPDISSEEILKRKNFDSVLKQYTSIHKPFYKNPWFLSGAGIVIVAAVTAIALKLSNTNTLTTQSVKQETTAIDSAALANFYKNEEAKPCINPPLSGIDIPSTTYKVIAEKGAILDFKTGSKIIIPKNSFTDNGGKLLKGEIELHYREFHDPVDFFLSGIPMTYDSAGSRYHFESAGMMEMMAYQDGKPVNIAPGKLIDIELASNYTGSEYNLYKLDTIANNWSCLGKDKIVEDKPDSGIKATTSEKQLEQTIEYKTVETKKEEVQKERNKKIAALPKLIAEPEKPEQAKKDKYTFNLDIDAREYPELDVYKGVLFEVGNENKNFNSSMYAITWDEAIIKEGPEKERNYLLTLKKASKKYDLVVYPVFEGKNYETAMKEYQERYSKYTAALDKRKAEEKKVEEEYQAQLARLKKQQEKIELKWKERQDSIFRQMSAQEKVHRAFAISGFGVYNCDNPSLYPTGVSCTARLNNEKDIKLMCYDVFLVDNEKNALFSYTKNPVVKFSFNPESKNLLWTVENGVLYWLKPEQFREINGTVDISDLRMNKVEQTFKNADEMKAFFNF